MAKLGCQGKTTGSSTGLSLTQHTTYSCVTQIHVSHVQKDVLIYDEILWSIHVIHTG